LLGVTVFFDASGNCNKIEAQVFNRSTPTFLLAGHVVNDVSANKTVEIFNSISAGITFGYARYDLPAAGLRAIKWEAGDPFIHVIQVIPV
jgi:hypothetical protein